MLSNDRAGRFTSSTIHNLMKPGRGDKPSVVTLTYIEEKKMERRLQRALNADISSRPTSWGHIVEKHVASLLDPLLYDYCSDQTILHPVFQSWGGTPDLITKERVVDIKCPFTLKSFVQLADIAISNDAQQLKTIKPEYYWQLVSNAILTNKKQAELIVYCPYQSELATIRQLCENDDGDQNKLAWIYFATDEDLPYLVEGAYYKNQYHFVFEVSEDDVALLMEAVEAAEILLKE